MRLADRHPLHRIERGLGSARTLTISEAGLAAYTAICRLYPRWADLLDLASWEEVLAQPRDADGMPSLGAWRISAPAGLTAQHAGAALALCALTRHLAAHPRAIAGLDDPQSVYELTCRLLEPWDTGSTQTYVRCWRADRRPG